MKLITWNINSIRLRMAHLARLVREQQPDVVCLQEIKCHDDAFPLDEVRTLGFDHIVINGQKGYHGLAILSRRPLSLDAKRDLDGSGEARHLSVALPATGSGAPIILHNFYVPAGGDLPDQEKNPKFAQKLIYLDRMASWFAELSHQEGLRNILVGDLNVAPLEKDVWSHRQMLKVVSHTPIEVAALDAVQRSGNFHDVMRQFVPASEPLFTWWSYRARDWRRSNRGRRLDHIWTSPALQKTAQAMQVYDSARGWERPSDHAPVIAQFTAEGLFT